MIKREVFGDRAGKACLKPSGVKTSKRTSAYGIYFNDNKILLVKPCWSKLWELPGGGREKNESLQRTLKRELLEETGFEVKTVSKKLDLIVKTKFYADDLNRYFENKSYFYIITELGTQNKEVIDTSEIKKVSFVNLSKLKKTNVRDYHLKAIRSLKKKKKIN